MMDNTKTNESQENLHTDQISRMAKDYVQLWQKQWVSSMTDPKTQETLKECYSGMSALYEKNKSIFSQYAEAFSNASATNQQATSQPTAASGAEPFATATDSGSSEGTAAIYATLEQCLDVLERFGERISTLEKRVGQLESELANARRKTSSSK